MVLVWSVEKQDICDQVYKLVSEAEQHELWAITMQNIIQWEIFSSVCARNTISFKNRTLWDLRFVCAFIFNVGTKRSGWQQLSFVPIFTAFTRVGKTALVCVLIMHRLQILSFQEMTKVYGAATLSAFLFVSERNAIMLLFIISSYLSPTLIQLSLKECM